MPLPAPYVPPALPAPVPAADVAMEQSALAIRPTLPVAALPALSSPAVVGSRAVQVYPRSSAALQPFRRWATPGKRKRAAAELLAAAADVGELSSETAKRPRLGPGPTRLALDYANPTPSQVPVTEQMALVPTRVGALTLKRRLGADDLEPTVQLMKRPRLDPGSVPLALEGLPTGARVKVRRTKRKGPVDVHMVDVSIPDSATSVRRTRRRGSRRHATVPTKPNKRRRGGRRRLPPRDARGRFVRYHPTIRQPSGWEGGPMATPASVVRAVRPVVRYHPSIAQ